MTVPVHVHIMVTIGEFDVSFRSVNEIKSDAELVAATRAEVELDRVYQHIRALLAANRTALARRQTNRELKPGKVNPDTLDLGLTDKERAEAMEILNDDT